MLALGAVPAEWGLTLRFDRTAIEAGQWWRLLSAHWVHLGWAHLGLNLAGLVIMGTLFQAEQPARTHLGCLLMLSLLSSLGVYLGSDELHWYVGLSGVLHGYFIWGLLGRLSAAGRAQYPVWVSLGLLLGVWGKLLWEQSPWVDTGFTDLPTSGRLLRRGHL